MRKLIVAGLILLIPLALGAWLLLGTDRSQPPPEARAVLDGYLEMLAAESGATWQVQSLQRATKPGLVSLDKVGQAWGASESPFALVQPIDIPGHSLLTPNLPQLSLGGGQPLPFPPVAVWCVYLESSPYLDYALLAKHTNMYNADWVIHEIRVPGMKALWSFLLDLGCNPNDAAIQRAQRAEKTNPKGLPNHSLK